MRASSHIQLTQPSARPAAVPAGPTLRPAALGMEDAGEYLGGLSRQSLYRLHASGRVRIVKVGRRSVIPVADLDRLLGIDVHGGDQ